MLRTKNAGSNATENELAEVKLRLLQECSVRMRNVLDVINRVVDGDCLKMVSDKFCTFQVLTIMRR